MKIDPVCRILDAIRAPYALIGAHAMAARGYARFTVDVDLVTTDPRVLEPDTWAALERAGAVGRQSGILPCFLGGFLSRLVSSLASAAIRRVRVWRGRITSSMKPREAAT
jgi:hypothetical protein